MNTKSTLINRILLAFIIAVLALNVKGQLPSFSKTNQEVLYQSMDNIIAVDLNGANGELVSCKASKAQRLSKYADSLYAVYPSSTETDCLVKLYYKNIIVEQKLMEIVPPLQLNIKLEHEKNGVIQKNDLLKINEFQIEPISGKKVTNRNFKLITGSMTVWNPGGQIIFSGNVRDNQFTEQMIAIFKQLTQGSKISLTNPRIVNQYNQHLQSEPYKEWLVADTPE